MLLIKVINDYLYFVKINKAEGTYLAENDNLIRVLKYIKSKNINDSEEINKNVIIDFVKTCKDNNNCNKTINKSIASLRRSFKYSNIQNNDLFNYPNLIEEKKHFDFLSDYKINKLLLYLDNLDNNFINDKIVIIIKLLLETGSRISELLDIKLKNIDFKNNCVKLEHTKRHKQRYVFFTEPTKIQLKNYIKSYCKKENIYLFYNEKTKSKIVYSTIINYFVKIKKECKFRSFHPHMLRHTNATILASGGLNEFDLMTLLGHSSVATTQVYIHNNKKMLAKKFKHAFKKGNEDNNYNN